MILDQRYRWMPTTGGHGVCRVRAFQTPLGILMILTDVSSLESTVRLDQEFNCVIRALDAADDIRRLPGYAGMDFAMWFYGFDSVFGPLLHRLQRCGEFQAWGKDGYEPMAPEFLEPYLDGAKLVDLLEVRATFHVDWDGTSASIRPAGDKRGDKRMGEA